jgi:hypothetical protein
MKISATEITEGTENEMHLLNKTIFSVVSVCSVA